ncbi:MAG: Panacea domain-containing protein [Terriglobales bacterium]
MITRLPLEPEKLVASMLYIAHRVSDPTKWRIGKLVFLGDFAHLARYGRPVVGGRYCAMPNGPVPSEVLGLMNGLLTRQIDPIFWGTNVENSFRVVEGGRYPHFVPTVEANLEALSESDIEVLDEMLKTYGSMSFGDLSGFVHGLPAYVRATEREPDSKNPDMDYEDFFEENPFSVDGTKAQMIEDYALNRAFPEVATKA